MTLLNCFSRGAAERTRRGRGATRASMPTPKDLLLGSWIERSVEPVRASRPREQSSAPSAPPREPPARGAPPARRTPARRTPQPHSPLRVPPQPHQHPCVGGRRVDELGCLDHL